MCIVSFISNSNGFFLTCNRDELSTRSTDFPKKHKHEQESLFYAKDNLKSGTWLAINNTTQKLSCLLNAKGITEEKTESTLTRGLLPITVLCKSSLPFPITLLQKYSGFALLIFEYGNLPQLELWHWNQKTLTKKEFNPYLPYIWASDTLYDKNYQKHLQVVFKNQIAQINSQIGAIRFHSRLVQTPENNVFIKKNDLLKTVSISSIYCSLNQQKTNYYYRDLIKNKNVDRVMD